MEKDANCNGTHPASTDTVYYGVYIPTDQQIQESDGCSNVFQDKVEALKAVKKYKKARFKAFNFYHEALEFAIHGSEFPNNNVTPTKTISGSIVANGVAGNKEIIQQVGEKPPQFRGPKSQDLVRLRKGIETAQFDMVQTTIWDNPRYLVSSGDTPSILQEGSRYNALHVAAKAKNRNMCELILNTISNTNFIKLLYGDDTHQDANERAKILLDLYLNTPDKGLNETPLHFAVKFGAVDVVELLVSFPQCDKTVVNKFDKSPSMIICDRCEEYVSSSTKNKIATLLQETYYVPVLRSENNCTPPVIGEPFAPTSPPEFNMDMLLPRMEIHAYAGPMNKEGADKFRRVWKTPPRAFRCKLSTKDAKCSPLQDVTALKFNDLDKGLERLGRALASEYEVGWKEYWPFLNNFVDLASPEGLQLLENYIGERANSEYSCSSSPNNTSSSDSELTINSPIKQSKNNLSPMSELCKNLAACNLNRSGGWQNNNAIKSDIYTSCSDKMEKSPDILVEGQLCKPDINPFLCIERSCQVFAHRISYDILRDGDFENTSVKLESEIRQLELLMASFMDDNRFDCVDFHSVHFRLGCLISNKLKQILLLEDEYYYVAYMKRSLQQWLENCSKHFDYFSSDDESANFRNVASVQKKPTSKIRQVMCVLEATLNTLTLDPKDITENTDNEEECVRLWTEAKPCVCVWHAPTTRRSSFTKKCNNLKLTAVTPPTSLRYISKQLYFGDDDDSAACNNSNDCCDMLSNNDLPNNQDVEDSLSDEEYFTAPSTPTCEESSDEDEENFEDSFSPDLDIFIEGNIPTKSDCTVYNAVLCIQDRINPRDYPHIYKWRHAVSLYSEGERKSWTSPSIGRYVIGTPNISTSTPRVNKAELHTRNLHTPPNSWLRITGANSPTESFRRCGKSNLSFNL